MDAPGRGHKEQRIDRRYERPYSEPIPRRGEAASVQPQELFHWPPRSIAPTMSVGIITLNAQLGPPEIHRYSVY
jgi:hypothetical protein